jgi:hypothetical protein
MTPQELLLLVFWLVDGELIAPDLAHPRQHGPQPLLHDSEVITIELVGELLGLDRDARQFWHFRHYHAAEFPALLLAHHTTFVRQAANLWRAKQLLQRRLAQRLAGAAADWLAGSMPLPACRYGCGGYCMGFRGQADSGYDPVQRQTYYGFRLHLRTSRRGVILACERAPGSAADAALVPELAPPPGTTGISDRNTGRPT